MNFATPWALALVPVVLLAAWWGTRSGRRGAVVFSSVELAELSGATWRTRLAWLPGAMAALAMVLLAVALARPRLGIGEVRTLANGVAIMMVLDRSASMALPLRFQGEDRPRLDVVKQVFSEFVEGNGGDLPGRPEDLIGLVAFARFAETVCPLVRVHGTLNKLVESMQIAEQQVEGGTAVGDGLALGAARLREAEKELAERNKGEQDPEFTIKSKVIVLLTDGDENAGETRAADAARVCADPRVAP
jgi:Ca-activated chloride channel family protein